jgi:hypothetical protein
MIEQLYKALELLNRWRMLARATGMTTCITGLSCKTHLPTANNNIAQEPI